jgi:hypothetical protein
MSDQCCVRVHAALKDLYESAKIVWEEIPEWKVPDKREAEIRMRCYQQAMQMANIAIQLGT